MLDKTPELSLTGPWEVGQVKKGRNNYRGIKEQYEQTPEDVKLQGHGKAHGYFRCRNMSFKTQEVVTVSRDQAAEYLAHYEFIN